jgi:hypothetical protein
MPQVAQPFLANPGQPSPAQLLAGATGQLINSVQGDPTDPTQMVAPTSMDPTQQQVSDAEQAPINERPGLADSYAHVKARRMAPQSAGGMSANRATMQSPQARHIQQYQPGSQYINQGMLQDQNGVAGGLGESQNLPAYTEAQDRADHPGEVFASDNTGANASLDPTLTGEDRNQDIADAMQGTGRFATTDEKELDRRAKLQEENNKEAADYQQSLQGTGQYAKAEASGARADERLKLSEARNAMKDIEGNPAYRSVVTGKFDPTRLSGDDADMYQNAKAAITEPFGGTPAKKASGVKAIPAHGDGMDLTDPATGKRYIVQNGRYVEQQ